MPISRFAAVALAVLVPTVALAEPGTLRNACGSDVKALCAGVQPGGGRIRACMKEHRAQLSVSCKLAIADRMLERPSHPPANGSASIKSVPQAR